MLRDTAVTRIARGLGFRTDQDSNIVLCLQEAQRELEAGKTLPKFLLQEADLIQLTEGDYQASLPSGFIRLDEENPELWYFIDGTATPQFIRGVTYAQGLKSFRNTSLDSSGSAPQIFAIRRDEVNFINPVDADYDLYWTFYQRDEVLSSNIENLWLTDTNCPEWIIGEAGYKLALDLRDQSAMALFDDMRKKGRAACLGDTILDQLQTGPEWIGEDN